MVQHPEPEERPARIPPLPPQRTAVGAATAPPGRPFLIVRGSVVIGRSRLEYPLPWPGAYAGRFLPESEYEAHRPVFELYKAALQQDEDALLRRFVRERDALELRVLSPSGAELDGRVDLISHWETGVSIVHLTLRESHGTAPSLA